MRGFLFVLKISFLCATTIICTSAAGQSTAELALKNLQRQKWQRAHELLTKALAKDSLNVTAKYVLAQYFFSEANPAFNLDSAYDQLRYAINDFQNTSSKQRERLRRFPLDSALLIDFREQIELAAFNRTNDIQTLEAWTRFISRFTHSSLLHLAIASRDSIAYQEAVQINTYQGFQYFFEKYPHAAEVQKARTKYEKLLFEAKTSDQTLSSYETFVSEYPQSPYRPLAENTIFEYRTSSGETNAYVKFIRSYPKSPLLKKAKNILFHLIPEHERPLKWPSDLTDDSLRVVMKLEQAVLAPIYTNKKFGFIDSEGNEIIAPQADSIDQSYLCGNVQEDIISLPHMMVAKNGAFVWKKNATNIDDIGSGFLLVRVGDCTTVIHKTGFAVGENCVDDAKILNGKFLATQENRRWSIWTLTGRSLLTDVDEVFFIKDVLTITRNDSVELILSETLAALPSPERRGVSSGYDEARSWNNELVFVKKGNSSGLLDQSLIAFIPLKEQTLTPFYAGVIATDSAGTQIHNYGGKKSEIFQQVLSRDPWLAVKDSLWKFIDPTNMQTLPQGYDTIVFHGLFAAGFKKDSVHIFFSMHKYRKELKSNSMEFMPGEDASGYLMVRHEETKTVFNNDGQKLFTVTFDKIQYAGEDFFIVHKKEKKGLLTVTGKLLLPVEYDAIGTVSNGQVSLLKSMQFGRFDCNTRKIIAAQYSKNPVPYNKKIITAYKDGQLGFIDWNNRSLSKFEFNEIQYWNDTTALVKKNSEWMLYEIKNKKILLDKIKDFKFIRNTLTDKVAIIYQDFNHGVVHNRKGTIIPTTFSYIVNVGSSDKPLYFTEKHVTEASVFVVIYYNDEGKKLRKEIYDQEDYDKIYCDEH
ncbi:WG repeat-containing protein [Chryseolinea sp. H1M3-3]|uniref:WG repeat-containing protein n=1 Tax=Chryseolinea sp. H1M3-3 TaxID=3034144 RepID=UPI0023EC2E44|nr:WG repeat-containing protein [Chryseolinea sp. H1M3-3]